MNSWHRKQQDVKRLVTHTGSLPSITSITVNSWGISQYCQPHSDLICLCRFTKSISSSLSSHSLVVVARCCVIAVICVCLLSVSGLCSNFYWCWQSANVWTLQANAELSQSVCLLSSWFGPNRACKRKFVSAGDNWALLKRVGVWPAWEWRQGSLM